MHHQQAQGHAPEQHLIVYTLDCSLGVAAASKAEQQAWYNALLEVRKCGLLPLVRPEPGVGGKGGRGGEGQIVEDLV